MNEPSVVRLARQQKDALLAREEDLMREMAQKYLQIETALQGDITLMAMEAAQLRDAGQPVGKAEMMRNGRLTRLLFSLRAQTGEFANWAAGMIAARQEDAAQRGIDDAAASIQAVHLDAGKIGPMFNIVPLNALAALIGFAGDGKTLQQYLAKVHGDAADGLIKMLLDGLAQGKHPVDIAREMVKGIGLGLNQALNLARTEILRAYREGSLRQYDESGVVIGYKRVAAHDGRTCAGCLFTEGEFYPTQDGFAEHPQGRCTLVPVIDGLDEPNWEGGAAWFEKQPEDVQQSILGPERFKAWKNGLALADMVKRIEDPVWGGMFVPAPIR